MKSSQEINIDLNSVQQIQSVRRAGSWVPAHQTAAGKTLIGLISVVLVGGVLTSVIVPFTTAAAKADSENAVTTTTTAITFTTTTATTSTITTVTTTTATTTTSTVTTSTTTSTTTGTTSTTSSSTSTTTSTTASTRTTSTTSTTSSTTTTTTTSSTSTTTSTSTTATTTTTTTSSTTTTVPPSATCSSNTSSTVLYSNQFIYSPTGQLYAAGMLNNQFGVYRAYGYGNVTSTALWTASQSATSAGALFAAQNDRNLVVYASNSTVLWTANIFISGLTSAFCLQMLDTGNLTWADPSNVIIWQTNSTVTSG